MYKINKRKSAFMDISNNHINMKNWASSWLSVILRKLEKKNIGLCNK